MVKSPPLPAKSPPAHQLKSSYFQPAVAPLAMSEIQLPGGQNEPNYYCLGVDSTIPFISLKGGGATQKVISWGEMIEVLPGQAVTVKNESYMQGDIQINSGNDYAAKPERISLAVTTKTEILNPFTSRISSLFPADTRRCRRAYLKFQAETALTPIVITFTGKPQKHSFPGTDSVTGLKTYTESYTISPFTSVGELPMGYGSDVSVLTPMGLTDQVSFILDFPTVDPGLFINTLFMYCLEY